MEIKTINNLWKLPDSGKISNPYFEGKREVETNLIDAGSTLASKENNSYTIPFTDDTDSVNTPSTTDESDDSLINNGHSKVDKVKKKRRVMKKQSKQDPIDASSANVNNDSKEPTQPLDTNGTSMETHQKNQIDAPSANDNKEPTQLLDNNGSLMETQLQDTIVSSRAYNKETTNLPVTNGVPMETQQYSSDKPKCIRIGCCDSAIKNPDWDFEYCSAKCAVEHCKTAFLNWVTSRQSESINSTTT